MRTQLEGSVCGMTEPAAASDSIHPQPAASPSPSSASSIPLPCHTRSWSSSSRLQWQDYVEKQEGNMEDKQQSIHNGSIGIAHFGRGSSIVNWHQSVLSSFLFVSSPHNSALPVAHSAHIVVRMHRRETL